MSFWDNPKPLYLIVLIFENQFSGRSSWSSAHATSVRSFEIFVRAELARPLLLTRRLLGVPESLFTDCIVGLHLAAVVLDNILTFFCKCTYITVCSNVLN